MGLQNTQNLITDFCRDNTQSILLKQYEKNSRFIIVKCTENGVFKKLDKGTMTCNIKVLTPDDRAIFDPCEILDDGTVKVSVSESMVYAAGVAKAELNIFDDSTATLLATMVFNFIIKPSAYSDDKIIASDEFSALTELITKAEKEQERLKEAKFTLYDHFSKGILSEKDYQQFSKKYDDAIARLDEDIKSLRKCIADLKEARRLDDEFIAFFEKYGNIQKLDRDVLNSLVDHVVYNSPEHVEIFFNFSAYCNKIHTLANVVSEVDSTG